MRKWSKGIKSFQFQLKWVCMSPQQRYACLWARTKKQENLDFTVLSTVTNNNK
jgi:hypothetical protein